MADLTYYAAKIAECLRLLESSNDPLYRDVYQAMADEFAEKYATLSRRMAEETAQATPPSPLLTRVAPPPPEVAPAATLDVRLTVGERRGAGHPSTMGAERAARGR